VRIARHPGSEEADMAEQNKCAHCGSKLIDRSTVVERNGKTFCCRNCAAMMEEK
jgi:hypothetical protein